MLNSVMIIDDTEADRYIAKWSLEKRSLASNIYEASDGKEAIEILKNYENSRRDLGEGFPPALILLDVNMPRMNGFEFLDAFAKLRKEAKDLYESVVVMMFTSSSLEEDKEKAFGFEFVRGYLNKPFNPEDLSEIIIKHFEGENE